MPEVGALGRLRISASAFAVQILSSKPADREALSNPFKDTVAFACATYSISCTTTGI